MDVFVEKHHRIHNHQKHEFLESHPTVDVFITAAGEPDELVEKTVRAALAMEYTHGVFLCDDGKSPYLKSLSAELGVNYITRTN